MTETVPHSPPKDRDPRLAGCSCVRCARLVDAASPVPGTQSPLPEPGDLTICLYCRQPMAFVEVDGKLSLREATAEEAVHIRAAIDLAAGRTKGRA